MCEYIICDGVILGRFDLNGGVVRELYIGMVGVKRSMLQTQLYWCSNVMIKNFLPSLVNLRFINNFPIHKQLGNFGKCENYYQNISY